MYLSESFTHTLGESWLDHSTKSIYPVIEKEGEYPTSLWYCVTILYRGHDLCNDIHKFEVSLLAVYGHIARL